MHPNLRNHRKLLVVDGRVGFTGGMNLGDHHVVSRPLPDHREKPGERVRDLHFRVEGPVLVQLEEVFREDWVFCTKEEWPAERRPAPEAAGEALCRGIGAGPDEQFEKLHWIIVGALACAHGRVQIMTPYFLPGRELVSAIKAAALRGVAVELLLPERSNIRIVDWATRSMLWELLKSDVRVFLGQPPFRHTKLFLVDGHYALVGSTNLDERSLRLNFEFNLEVHDEAFVARLERHFEEACAGARELSLEDVDGRSLPVRLRDAGARLFGPYL